MSFFRSKTLIAAKAISAKDWDNPRKILKARRMADAGALLSEIAEACGWPGCEANIRRQLKRRGIRPHPRQKRSRRGDNTSLNTQVGFERFKAKVLTPLTDL